MSWHSASLRLRHEGWKRGYRIMIFGDFWGILVLWDLNIWSFPTTLGASRPKQCQDDKWHPEWCATVSWWWLMGWRIEVPKKESYLVSKFWKHGTEKILHHVQPNDIVAGWLPCYGSMYYIYIHTVDRCECIPIGSMGLVYLPTWKP